MYLGWLRPAASVDTVMRAHADSTRRAVFERIVCSDEITAVELTRGSGVTQCAIYLRSFEQAGLVAEHPAGRNVYYRARPRRLGPLAIGERLRVFWRKRFPISATL